MNTQDLALMPQAEQAASMSGGAVPRHVAIIMDGNGRWARARGMPRVAGHRAGAEAVRRTIHAARDNGVSWLTLYAFSSENWRRPASEVLDLTGLLRLYLRNEVSELAEGGVRLHVIGDRSRFSDEVQRELSDAERRTAHNGAFNLVMALSYGARGEIVAAARAASVAVAEGRLDPADITEDSFATLLGTRGMPDPDLILRTSGERRLSNFLLWQAAYAEFVFLDVLWPDFSPGDFAAALAEYARRDRRFGARPA